MTDDERPERPHPARRGIHRTRKGTLVFLPRQLSKWGFCSRKQAEEMVTAGRVRVNGTVRRDVLFLIQPHHDVVEVDGARVTPAGQLYLKMHKPRGVVTTTKDEKDRRSVADLLPGRWKGAMPVGRLDLDSSGLLLLTNDHDLGNALLDKGSAIDKVYRVAVSGFPDDEQLQPMRDGLFLAGEKTLPAIVRIVERRKGTTLLEVVLHEGKNRQIRRSLSILGFRVLELHRVAIGPIEIGSLAPGDVVELTSREVDALRC